LQPSSLRQSRRTACRRRAGAAAGRACEFPNRFLMPRSVASKRTLIKCARMPNAACANLTRSWQSLRQAYKSAFRNHRSHKLTVKYLVRGSAMRVHYSHHSLLSRDKVSGDKWRGASGATEANLVSRPQNLHLEFVLGAQSV
jgi:hypothetical protein